MKYKLIDRSEAMRAAMENLSGFSSLALDLEMENHYHHYGLHIALIQISTPRERTFVFDPLSGIDPEPLGALLVDPRIELIVHDADFDKRACRRIYGWKLCNIFDTKVAAQLCGFKQYGLAALLNDLLKVETNKKFQRFDWMKRPLRKDALDYAAGETGFLFRIKDILVRRLLELGRLDWAREEFARIENFNEPENDTPAYSRIKGSSALTPRQLAVLESLAQFRDRRARQAGRPVHFIIRNKTLIQLAVSPPRDADEVKKAQGLHPSLYRATHARRLVRAVERGLQDPEIVRPEAKGRQASTPGYNTRLKAMQKWRAGIAANLDIEPYLLLSNEVLRWCARNPGRPLPGSVASQIRDWQKRLVWEDFCKLFSAS